MSHLHMANNLNVLLHAAPRDLAPGVIDSATAYSASPAARNVRLIIGAALPLRLSVRWYPTPALPRSWQGSSLGGHVYPSTLVYCLLCIGATAAACLAYFRGVELPRKLRRYGADRVGGGGGMGDYGGGPRGGMGGYAYYPPATATGAHTTAHSSGGGGGYAFGRTAGKFD